MKIYISSRTSFINNVYHVQRYVKKASENVIPNLKINRCRINLKKNMNE